MTERMRGAWWWIDRWRKSTAYTDLTLAEQGAYRNLLDELWLRGGLLPDDERILAKISGDALAWPEVREAVLRHFVKAEGGLRNPTHDEVAAESKRRAEKQKRYRDRPRDGNVTGNVTGNGGRNVLPSPSPSPSPSKNNGQQRTTDSPAGKPPAPVQASVVKLTPKEPSWSQQAAGDFKAVYGGAPTVAFFAQLKPLVKLHGWPAVRPVLREYMAETPVEFMAVGKVLAVKVPAALNGHKGPQRGPRPIESPVDAYERSRKRVEAELAGRSE